jgi:hypothetical protein
MFFERRKVDKTEEKCFKSSQVNAPVPALLSSSMF